MVSYKICFSYFLLNVLIVIYSFENSCFCKIKGEIDDCVCTAESVDNFNNEKVQPLLDGLLQEDYFRYFKVNIFRDCPFESTSSKGKCSSRSCAVDECSQDNLPLGFKDDSRDKNNHEKNKYKKEENEKSLEENCEDKNRLGNLDVTLSQEKQGEFESWTQYDHMQDNFCELEDIDCPNAVYYDLVLNPERFTGYTGPSAVNVWKLIYDQNCFKSDNKDYDKYLSIEKGLCLEKRTFFRLISGFHTSINVDVTSNWLMPGRTAFDRPQWGPNLEEFVKRFDPKLTWGEGPNRLKNMYFTYLVEMRALVKAAPYLLEEEFYTGNKENDLKTKETVTKLLNTLKGFPEHFDESKLFQGDAKKMKEEFKVHFRNISHVMDCVGCDKCRLWGKVQFMGMGTALKILFSGESMRPDSIVEKNQKGYSIPFQLSRGEIVALFNAFGRLSKSIHELEVFRKMMK